MTFIAFIIIVFLAVAFVMLGSILMGMFMGPLPGDDTNRPRKPEDATAQRIRMQTEYVRRHLP
jgi:hypothetical protein